jgi:acyl-CoA reductase-like NAD-dependent aldehyde dehydrogenase
VLAEVFHEAGFQKGVLNVVTNGPRRNSEIGNEFVENPEVRRINLTGSAAVFTSDLAKGMAIADQIESGMVHINDQTVCDEPQVPF